MTSKVADPGPVDIGGGNHHARRSGHLDRAVRLVVLEAERGGDRQGLLGATVVGHGDLAGDLDILGPVDEAERERSRPGLAVPGRQVGAGNGAIHADLTGTDALDRGQRSADRRVRRAVPDVGLRVVHQQGLDLGRRPIAEALHQQGRRPGHHRRCAGGSAERRGPVAGSDLRGDRGTRCADLRLDDVRQHRRAAGRRADHRLLEREPRIRIELDGDRPCRDGVLQVVAEGLEDHVAGNVVAGILLAVAESARERLLVRDEADDPDHAARQGDVRDLLAEVAGPTLDQDDEPVELTRAEGILGLGVRAVRVVVVETAPEALAIRAVVEGQLGVDHRGQVGRPVLVRRLVDARELRRLDDLEERELGRGNGGLRDGQGARRGRRRARDIRLVRAVAGRSDRQDPDVGGVFDGLRQVIVEGLTVVVPERHVDDVDVVGGDPVAVRVEGVVHAQQERDAAAGRGDCRAHLDGLDLDAGGDADLAADDVGDVRAVAAVAVDQPLDIGIDVLAAAVRSGRDRAPGGRTARPRRRSRSRRRCSCASLMTSQSGDDLFAGSLVSAP